VKGLFGTGGALLVGFVLAPVLILALVLGLVLTSATMLSQVASIGTLAVDDQNSAAGQNQCLASGAGGGYKVVTA